MSLEICPADIGHSFQSCAFGETVWPRFVLEEPSNCINRAGSAGTDFSLRNVPENSKRRNQENTGNRIRVMYLYYIFTAKRTLLKGEWREPHVWIINYKRSLNGIYGHYGNEL